MATAPHIVTFLGAKGGVGTTIIATNLAEVLAQVHQAPTALCAVEGSEPDAERMLATSHVRLVAESTLSEAVPAVRWVIVDAGSSLTPQAVTALEHSNLILLVLTPDLLAAHHALRLIERLTAAQFPLQMIRVVLNRSDSPGHYRTSDVKKLLPVPLIAEIPSDGRSVGMALNNSALLVTQEPETRIVGALKALAQTLVSSPQLFVKQFHIDRRQLPMAGVVLGGLVPSTERRAQESQEALDPVSALKQKIHTHLVEQLDLKRLDLSAVRDPRRAGPLRQRIEQTIITLMTAEGGFISSPEDRSRLVKEIMDEAIGLGPLEDLIADTEVSDILVNGPTMIYVERHGKLTLTDKRFLSSEQLSGVIERIIAPLGRRIDEFNPMVDARLPDGSRVNAIIPPLSICGPVLSIRKFGERYTLEDLIRFGTLDAHMAQFLSLCVRARKNIIVSGGTGSGKTTLLNVISSFIPDGERIVTIEDAAEMRLSQRHWVPLESRPPNIEGRGQITIRQLFHNALRMRPDRIVIGECRSDETLDMLQAMNTGHDGSLTTLHANAPQDVISRLDTLVLMSHVDLPVRAIREQIASAVDLIVHTVRFIDGSRRVTHITEIAGLEESRVAMKDIFLFQQEGLGPHGEVRGRFVATGYVPSFFNELKQLNLPVDEGMFQSRSLA